MAYENWDAYRALRFLARTDYEMKCVAPQQYKSDDSRCKVAIPSARVMTIRNLHYQMESLLPTDNRIQHLLLRITNLGTCGKHYQFQRDTILSELEDEVEYEIVEWRRKAHARSQITQLKLDLKKEKKDKEKFIVLLAEAEAREEEEDDDDDDDEDDQEEGDEEDDEEEIGQLTKEVEELSRILEKSRLELIQVRNEEEYTARSLNCDIEAVQSKLEEALGDLKTERTARVEIDSKLRSIEKLQEDTSNALRSRTKLFENNLEIQSQVTWQWRARFDKIIRRGKENLQDTHEKHEDTQNLLEKSLRMVSAKQLEIEALEEKLQSTKLDLSNFRNALETAQDQLQDERSLRTEQKSIVDQLTLETKVLTSERGDLQRALGITLQESDQKREVFERQRLVVSELDKMQKMEIEHLIIVVKGLEKQLSTGIFEMGLKKLEKLRGMGGWGFGLFKLRRFASRWT